MTKLHSGQKGLFICEGLWTGSGVTDVSGPELSPRDFKKYDHPSASRWAPYWDIPSGAVGQLCAFLMIRFLWGRANGNLYNESDVGHLNGGPVLLGCKVSADLFTKDLLRPGEGVEGCLASEEQTKRMASPCPPGLFEARGRLRSSGSDALVILSCFTNAQRCANSHSICTRDRPC